MGTVRYLAPDTDAYVGSVQRHASEFEARTGHRLEVRIRESDEYFSNRIGARLSGDDAGDPLGSGPLLEIREGTDGGLRGFGQRGRGEWHTMYTGFATELWSCGARDFDPDGRAAFADEDAVAVTAGFIEALRDAGPVDWTEQRWYELALGFGRGRYALLVDSDRYVAFFEDERHSELVGRIGYALPRLGRIEAVPPALRRRGQHEPDVHEHLGQLLDDHATVLVTPTPQYREIARGGRGAAVRRVGLTGAA